MKKTPSGRMRIQQPEWPQPLPPVTPFGKKLVAELREQRREQNASLQALMARFDYSELELRILAAYKERLCR